ncbi:CDP-glucose 4,6-dehydratase [Neisseriaceae bacterium JH1-16]|nr:CDP-glucose 4,6-dehydratase [Neisseriaceae bacterium JH1-16]
MSPNPAIWAGRRVLVTGHTGFKGGWLALWLHSLGAKVVGYALPPTGSPDLFTLAGVADTLSGQHLADLRDAECLTQALRQAEPEVVLHLAAQPLVRTSYRDPVDTFATNVMGTVNVLEAVRQCPSVKAVVVVTTDKCYENREWAWGYRENDPLGGHDPYSASKACTEIVAASYRRAFFQNGPLLATARAGNVIGGGDWSEDRLVPDAVRAVGKREPLVIRSPHATRPWQHVLEPLNGYLMLAERLLAGDASCAGAWNFGPDSSANLSVAKLLDGLQRYWPELNWCLDDNAGQAPHEANLLYLDSSLARQRLGWQPVWSLEETLEQTASWYQQVLAEPSMARQYCERQIQRFSAAARKEPR